MKQAIAAVLVGLTLAACSNPTELSNERCLNSFQVATNPVQPGMPSVHVGDTLTLVGRVIRGCHLEPRVTWESLDSAVVAVVPANDTTATVVGRGAGVGVVLATASGRDPSRIHFPVKVEPK